MNGIEASIGICTLLSRRRTFLALSNSVLLEMALIIFDPILALKLSNDYGFTPL